MFRQLSEFPNRVIHVAATPLYMTPVGRPFYVTPMGRCKRTHQ